MEVDRKILRKTCRRYDNVGDAHFLTFSSFRRQPFFSGKDAPRWFLENLNNVKARLGFSLWGYVIMPEHVHLMLLPAKGSSISAILRFIKKPFTDRIIKYTRESSPEFLEARMLDIQPNGRKSYRFWQRGGGYDRNIFSIHELREKLEYIHANPVRRGLTETPEEWPWSSYLAWETGSDFPIAIDRGTFPTF